MSKHRRRNDRNNPRLSLERLEHRNLLAIGAFDVPSGVAPGDVQPGGDNYDGVIDLNGGCTGSLSDRAQFNATDVGGRHILTAAHCVVNEERQSIGHNELGTAQFQFTGRDNPATPGGAIVMRTTGDLALTTAFASDLQSELEALSNIGAGNVRMTGSAGDWSVRFKSDLGFEDVTQLQAVNLAGGADVDVDTTSAGGPADSRATVNFYIPVPNVYDNAQIRDIRRVSMGGDVVVNPNYNGDTEDGNDLAMIYLDEIAPHDASAYDVQTTNDEIGQPMRLIGYGRTGTGTIEAGRGTPTEIQRIRISATGGDFRLAFSGDETGNLDASAVTANDIETALEGLADIGDVLVRVAAPAGNPYAGDFEIRWLDDVSSLGNQPELQVVDVDLTGGSVSVATLNDNANVEHQRLQINASGGTFDVQLDVDNDGTPENSATLPFNAGAAAIESALEGFAAFPEVTVFASTISGGNFEIVFNAVDGGVFSSLDISTLSVDTTSLSGSAFVRTVQDGGLDTRRFGDNHWSGLDGANGNLEIDFDDGTAGNNSHGDNLGVGAAEGMPGPGDSGGPGFIVNGGNLTVAGVVSRGGQNFGDTEEYVRVSDFVPWITSHVTDSFFGAYDLVLNMAGHGEGNDGDSDSIVAKVVADMLELVVDGVTYYRDALTEIASLTILGSSDNDFITVDLSGGSWLPAAGVAINGNGGTNTVTVRGDHSLPVEYTTDPASVTGGKFDVLSHTVTVDGMTEVVAHSFFNLIFRTGDDMDDVNVDSPGTGLAHVDGAQRSRVHGTSGGHNFLPLTFYSVRSVDIDLNTNDAPGSDGDVIELHAVAASSLQSLLVNTGSGDDHIGLLANETADAVFLVGGSGNDTFEIGKGDLDDVQGVISVAAGLGNDHITLNDAGNNKRVNYTVTPTRVTSEFADGSLRIFRSVNFMIDTERVTVDGTQEENEFNVTPSVHTTFKVNGNLPVKPVPPNTGDLLEIEFAGTTGRKLNLTDPAAGDGKWEFSNRQDVEFMSIERFNFFPILVTGSEQGRRGRPVFQVFDAELGDLVLDTTVAYAPTSRTGVRVAHGDLNGDGIPEIVTAPGRLHAPIVKSFDVLTGAKLPEFFFRAYSVNYDGGAMVAVGDVNGDGLNDIVTSPSRGVSYVRTFENQLVSNPSKAFSNRPSKQFRAFSRNFTGGSSVAVADMNGDNRDDVIVGSGTGTRSRVQVWDVSPVRPAFLRGFLTLDASRNSRGGISVATGRVDNDATPDIIIGDGRRGLSRIQILDGLNGSVLSAFTAYPGANAEVRVTARDLDGDDLIDSIFSGQGTDGEEHRVDRFLTNGIKEAIDFNFAGDLDFVDGGFFLG